MQEWFPCGAATVGRLPGIQQVTEADAMAGSVLIEGADRGQFPVHGRLAAMTIDRRQHRDRAGSRERRQPQPGDELADILEPYLAPIQPADAEEGEPVLQVVGVRLHRVRRPLDVAQVGQVSLDRLHRRGVVAQHRPRLKRRGGQHYSSNKHRTSEICMMDGGR